MYTLWRVLADRFRRIGLVEGGGVGHHGRVHMGQILAAHHGRDHRCSAPSGELGGQRADPAEHALHQHDLSVDRTVAEHGAMSGDPGDAEAGPDLVTEVIRQGHGLLGWFELMQVIARLPECRVHDIASDLAITVGGTSKFIDRIEASGYCRRRANPGDRRSSIIGLTPAGRRLLARTTKAYGNELEIRLGSAVSGRSLAQFDTTLRKLRTAARSTDATSRRPNRGKVDTEASAQ